MTGSAITVVPYLLHVLISTEKSTRLTLGKDYRAIALGEVFRSTESLYFPLISLKLL